VPPELPLEPPLPPVLPVPPVLLELELDELLDELELLEDDEPLEPVVPLDEPELELRVEGGTQLLLTQCQPFRPQSASVAHSELQPASAAALRPKARMNHRIG
jgi:hypothetical protein